MAPKTLFLLFPQWQGSGASQPQRLFEGCWQLQALLAERSFIGVPVDPEAQSETEAGVLRRAELLQHLSIAQAKLDGAQPERVFTLGGDCSVDAAPVRYLNERYEGRLAILWLDAHADLNTPGSSPSKAFHGMVLRALLGEGDPEIVQRMGGRPLEPSQVFLGGVRQFDPPELAYAGESRLRLFNVPDLEDHPERLIDTVAARGFEKLHIHLDLDVLAPEVFSSVGYPAPGGMTIEGLTRLLQALKGAFEVAGFTLTEYMPGEEGSEQALDLLEDLLRHVPLV